MRELWKNKSLFIVYLFSNLLLLVIPCITLITSIYATAKMQEESLMDSDTQITLQFGQVLDNHFEKMEEMYRALFMDSNVKKFLYRDRSLSSYDSYTILQIVELMSALRVHGSLIEDAFLYFPESGRVVTPYFSLDDSIYYSRIENYEGIEYTEWIDILKKGYGTITILDFPEKTRPGRIYSFSSLPVHFISPMI